MRSERGPILLSMMLATSLVAIDSTILATAIPTIVDDLGGFTQAPWLFSVYLLAQAATVPVYGKLADILGRKPIMVLGVVLFLIGSVLCALAPSMLVLILARGVQGLGAGAVQPMAQTIVGDVYTLAERAKVQGYMASVWAISSVVGPTLGGVFTTYLDWRWIFWVNLPLGVIALLLMRRFKESHERTSRRIDVLGSVLLTAGSAALILWLLEGGVSWGWVSTQSIALAVGGLVVLAVFGIVQRYVADPVLPGWLFTSRLLNTTNAVSLLVGALLIGLTAYVPIFAQTVLHQEPLIAGFALAALTLGWPIAASQSGKLFLRVGFKATGLIGSSIAVLGTIVLNLAGHADSVIAIAVACFSIGLGMGLVATPTLIAAQTSASTGTRGVVTGANMFARSLGSAFGVAIYGAVVNAAVAGRGDIEELPAWLLEPPLHQVFLGVGIAAVLLLVAVMLMPTGPRQPHLTATSAPVEPT